MKAAVVTERGVEVREVAKPAPGPEQVLVRVRAAGLNRADLGVAAGHAHGAIGVDFAPRRIAVDLIGVVATALACIEDEGVVGPRQCLTGQSL